MSTDEPVCNTQLSSDLRSCMIFFSILKSQIIKARKNLNVYFDFYCDMCLLKLFLHHLHMNKDSFHNRCTINTVEFLWGRPSFTMQPRISGCNCCTEGIRNTLFQFSLLSLRHTLVWTNYWLLQTDSSPLQLFSLQFPFILPLCFLYSLFLFFCFPGIVFLKKILVLLNQYPHCSSKDPFLLFGHWLKWNQNQVSFSHSVVPAETDTLGWCIQNNIGYINRTPMG